MSCRSISNWRISNQPSSRKVQTNKRFVNSYHIIRGALIRSQDETKQKIGDAFKGMNSFERRSIDKTWSTITIRSFYEPSSKKYQNIYSLPSTNMSSTRQATRWYKHHLKDQFVQYTTEACKGYPMKDMNQTIPKIKQAPCRYDWQIQNGTLNTKKFKKFTLVLERVSFTMPAPSLKEGDSKEVFHI